MKLSYPAIFYPWNDGDGYTVEVPDLQGCVTQGNCLTEAILMGIDAASGWIATSLELGRQIPPPSRMDTIKPDPEINEDGGAFINILALDLDEYAKKWGKQTVQRVVDVPAYLSSFAESQQLDLSRFMQDGLKNLYQQHNA